MEAFNKWAKTTVVALSILAFSGAVASADSPQDVVKARQAAMKSFGADSKAISDYVKGAGDKDAAVKAAGDYGATATKLAKMWPKGTSSADMPGVSKAKPAIWTDSAKFNASFGSMTDGAKKLADVIKTGSTDDVKAASVAFAKANCAACHSNYRESQ
jgi:cytochrome c556